MRGWIGGALALLLAACATDRSALRPDLPRGTYTPAASRPAARTLAPEPLRGPAVSSRGRPAGTPARSAASASTPRLPARPMTAEELAQRMGLGYEDASAQVVLSDRSTQTYVRIWKDSNEVSVAGRVARLPSRTQRMGRNLMVPATTVSYVEREILAYRKRLDAYTAYAPKPVRAPAPIALPKLVLPESARVPPTPTEPQAPAPLRPPAPDPAWARLWEAPRAWRWIVIHHSDDTSGNLAKYDRVHKDKGWDECGYHFVIGNGTLSGDGEVEISARWPKQKHGAHCKGANGENCFNEQGIGICLVGDFELGGRPTARQMDSLVRLCRYLMDTYDLPLSMVVGHEDCKPTACPGKHFPWAELRRRLATR